MSFALMHNPVTGFSQPTQLSPLSVPALEPLPPVPPSMEAALAGHSPAERKVLMDLYMRKHYPELWRTLNEKSRLQKTENVARTGEPRMLQQPSGQFKRAAEATDEFKTEWQNYCNDGKNTMIFDDPAALGTFCDEINGLSISGSYATSSNSVALEYIGERPASEREPFSYPVLVATGFDKGSYPYVFTAVERRLGTQTFPPAYPYRGDNRMREAVPVLAEDCELVKKYGAPESCKPFNAGDKVAQIDQFLTEQKTASGYKGVVFADPQVIEDWGSQSTLLRGGGLRTALAIREKEWRTTKIMIIVGYSAGGLAVAIGSAVIAVKTSCAKKFRAAVTGTVNSIKDAYAAWGQRRAVAGAKPADDADLEMQTTAPKNAGQDDSSTVGSASESSSVYLSDFSESVSSEGTGVGKLNASNDDDSGRIS